MNAGAPPGLPETDAQVTIDLEVTVHVKGQEFDADCILEL